MSPKKSIARGKFKGSNAKRIVARNDRSALTEGELKGVYAAKKAKRATKPTGRRSD